MWKFGKQEKIVKFGENLIMVKKNWKFGIIGNYKKIIKIWNFGKKTGSLKRIWKFRTKIGNLEKKNWKFGGKNQKLGRKLRTSEKIQKFGK